MRKILKGNLDCIGCPNYHVTKNGKVYSNYKGKGCNRYLHHKENPKSYTEVKKEDTMTT